MQAVKTYYRLTKPGIVYGNAFTAVAGYILGATHGFRIVLFIGTIAGICLVIAGGCVFNNVLDRNIDKHMARTKKRALVTGTIRPALAITYGVVLTLGGLSLLALSANWLTVGLGLFALVMYVAVYGYTKRFTKYGTAVGSVSGALPPVAGYVAASGRLDNGALVLFILLTVWQMPHFYAIAIYRMKEYAKAGVPILSVRRGKAVTQRRVMLYVGLFIIVAPLLTVVGNAGVTYVVIALGLAIGWLIVGLQDYAHMDRDKWARRMFRYSLAIVTLMPVTVAVARFLP